MKKLSSRQEIKPLVLVNLLIKRLNFMKGNLGIGHTRYSTSAASEEVNCQPFVVHSVHGVLAVAHNGELVNCEALRKMVMCDLKFIILIVCLIYFLFKAYKF